MVFTARIALVGALATAAQAHNWANTTVTDDVSYTTKTVTELTTYCPAPTTFTHGDNTYTVTEPTTLTITDCPCTITEPVEPTPTPAPEEDCAEKCTKAYDACRVAPGANMATCAAEYAACLNFNPFDGSNKTVTACSAEHQWTTEVVTHLTTYCPAPTTLTFDETTYTVSEATTLTISDCSCTVTKPVSTPHPEPTGEAPETPEHPGTPGTPETPETPEHPGTPGTPETPETPEHPGTPGTPETPEEPAATCPEECTAAYRECQTAPDANQSYCAAEIATCLGYSPFENGSFIEPTACSAGGQPPATTMMPSPTSPGGEEPGSPSSVPTAAANHLSPLGALGAIVAVALL